MIAFVRSLTSKLVALTILAASIFAASVLVVAPLYEQWQDAEERIMQSRTLLGRYLAAGGEAMPVRDAETPVDAYVGGETAALRFANLQARVSAAAKGRSIRLASMRASDAGEREGLHFIGLHAQFSTDLGRLQGFLYDLEAKEGGLMVGAVQIMRGPRAEGLALPALDVTLSVSGAVAGKEN